MVSVDVIKGVVVDRIVATRIDKPLGGLEGEVVCEEDFKAVAMAFIVVD